LFMERFARGAVERDLQQGGAAFQSGTLKWIFP
jgi:hypothetical protein